ncbi:hypothetical protein RCL1_002842 [Eukaryota sp. TZLM3-RCL]
MSSLEDNASRLPPAPSVALAMHALKSFRQSLPRFPSIAIRIDDLPEAVVETELPPVACCSNEPAPSSSSSQASAEVPVGRTTVNLTNNMIGSGVLAMGFVFSVAGIGLGFALMLLVAWLSSYTLKLMVINGKLARRYSYRQVAARAFGLRMSKGLLLSLSLISVVDAFIPIYGFGILIVCWFFFLLTSCLFQYYG